jgi:glycosyltransferase involved in cell wall biosynthesis
MGNNLMVPRNQKTENPVVILLSQFGQPVRGVSPYSTALIDALRTVQDITAIPADYIAAYPQILHPAGRHIPPTTGILHWAIPRTWSKTANLSGNILHIQHWSPPMAIYLVKVASMARRQGKQVLITAHNPEAHESLSWTKPFESRLFRESHHIIVHNESGKTSLTRRFTIPEYRISVVPHGIGITGTETQRSHDDYQRLNLSQARRYITIFGNLRGYKGVDIALEAWSRIEKWFPDTDLIIAGRLWSGKTGLISRISAGMLGTSRDAERIQRLLSRPELRNRVHMLEGFQADKTIDSLIRISDLAIFPYKRFNSQSGAACRAAGMGCPILASDVGGLPDLAINDEWIAKPNDTESLSKRLESILSKPGELADARALQLEHVRKFSWDRVADQHAAIYRDLLASGHKMKH